MIIDQSGLTKFYDTLRGNGVRRLIWYEKTNNLWATWNEHYFYAEHYGEGEIKYDELSFRCLPHHVLWVLTRPYMAEADLTQYLSDEGFLFKPKEEGKAKDTSDLLTKQLKRFTTASGNTSDDVGYNRYYVRKFFKEDGALPQGHITSDGKRINFSAPNAAGVRKYLSIPVFVSGIERFELDLIRSGEAPDRELCGLGYIGDMKINA